MSSEGPITEGAARLPPLAAHATVVSICGRGLMIRGASKAGKSTLALALIAASTPEQPVCLVGDDRVLLTIRGDELAAAPHPRILGLIEQRGCGILSMPYETDVPIAAVVDLDGGTDAHCIIAGKNFPVLSFVNETGRDARHVHILEWFAAASAAHRTGKTPEQP